MSHSPDPDRYQRLASQLPMRDPVAGPEQLRALGPRALVGALQGGARYGEALLDASEEAWTEYLDYIANEHPAFYVGDEGRIAQHRLSADGYRSFLGLDGGAATMIVSRTRVIPTQAGRRRSAASSDSITASRTGASFVFLPNTFA